MSRFFFYFRSNFELLRKCGTPKASIWNIQPQPRSGYNFSSYTHEHWRMKQTEKEVTEDWFQKGIFCFSFLLCWYRKWQTWEKPLLIVENACFFVFFFDSFNLKQKWEFDLMKSLCHSNIIVILDLNDEIFLFLPCSLRMWTLRNEILLLVLRILYTFDSSENKRKLC